MQVTNTSMGPRRINVKNGEGVEQVTLMPGETQDLDLHDQKHPFFKGLVDCGDIKIGKVDKDSEEGVKKNQVPLKPEFNKMDETELRAYIKDRTGKDVPETVKKAGLLEQAEAAYKTV